jgi:glucuronate isomerase
MDAPVPLRRHPDRLLPAGPGFREVARRLDSGDLARLVAEHLLDEDEALETAVDLVAGRPREVFAL